MSDTVLVAVIAAAGSICAAFISAVALIQSRATHQLINSRMDEMLSLTKEAARGEGYAAGEQAQRDRQGGTR